jgi:hypothetical protein
MKSGPRFLSFVRNFLICPVISGCFWAQTISALGQIAGTNALDPFPVPPAQSQPWRAPANLPADLATAVELLFQSGLADPRGCEYREIEVAAGDVWKPSPVIVKTHGWIFRPRAGAQTNFAIGWNGLVYRPISIGTSANPLDDAEKMIDALAGHGLENQNWVDEEYALSTQWLTPVKAAMILRFGPPELSARCARLLGTSDPFLLLATDRLWVAYDRGICAHMLGDDDVAYSLFQAVNSAKQSFESIARSRGLSTEQSPEGDLRKRETRTPLDSYFPFLDSLPVVLRDQKRRHQRQKPLPDPASVTNKTERIAALIDQLENIPGQDGYDLLKSPTVQALIREGWDAAPPLIQCFEQDNRLTRIVPVSHGGSGPWQSRAERTIVEVREPAYVALENILETSEFAPPYSRNQTPAEKAEAYRRAADAMRQYWKKYRGLPREERLLSILKDDHGNWLQAASILVQPTNQAVQLLREYSFWSAVVWQLPLSLDDRPPMYGESLRSRTNPSVTDLLVRRIRDLSPSTSENGDDAANLNEACNLAFCLARWDRQAATNQAAILCALSFRKLSPTNSSSLSSHMTLSGQLPALVDLRAKAGDSNALREYASWLVIMNPQQYSWQATQILQPLAEFADDPAWNPVWKTIFEDENSSWNRLLWTFSRRETNDWSSHGFNVEEFFATPVINRPEFRSFVIRLLHETSPGGKIMGDKGGYWLHQDLSTNRRFGYTLETPYPDDDLNGISFRTCDFYAWLISNRIVGAPEFQLYWPEARKDAALASLERLLLEKDKPLNTREFQKP